LLLSFAAFGVCFWCCFLQLSFVPRVILCLKSIPSLYLSRVFYRFFSPPGPPQLAPHIVVQLRRTTISISLAFPNFFLQDVSPAVYPLDSLNREICSSGAWLPEGRKKCCSVLSLCMGWAASESRRSGPVLPAAMHACVVLPSIHIYPSFPRSCPHQPPDAEL